MKKIITRLSLITSLLILLATVSSHAATFSITPAGNVVFNTHAGTQATQKIMITNLTSYPIYLTLTTTNPLFGISGSPTITIVADGTANVTLTYTTGLVASDTGKLNVVSTGGDSAAVTLIGHAFQVPTFQLIPPGAIVFHTQAGTQTSDSVGIRNLTTSPLNVMLWTGGNTAFGISGSKTLTIAPSGTVMVPLTFNPTAEGNDTGTFTVASSLDTVSAKLIGIATGLPKIQLIPGGDIVFTTRAGVQDSETIKIKNLADTSIYVTLSTSGSTLFAVNSSKTFTIPANGYQNVTLAFTPLVSGTYTGKFIVSTNKGDTVSANLIGHANTPGNGELTVANEVNFEAKLGGTECLPITIDNILGDSVIISAIKITGDIAEFSTTATGQVQIKPGASGIINVCFHPTTSAGGTATLSFNFMSPDSLFRGTQTVNLEGRVESGELPGDSLFFSVTKNVEFDDVLIGTTSCKAIEITNPTAQTVLIDSAVLSGAGVSSFTVSGASMLTISPDSTRFINVCFSPTVSADNQTATITLHYMIGGTATTGTITVNIEGNAIDSNNSEISDCIRIRHKNGVIGPIVAGGTATSSIFITNTTKGTITINSAQIIGNDSGAFSITGTGFPITLQSEQQGQLNISFSPKSVSGAPSFGATVNLNVTGTAMTCGPVSFHIEGVAVPGDHKGGHDTDHVDLGRGLDDNGTDVIGIVNNTKSDCIIDTVIFDNTTDATVTINNVVIPSNRNIQILGSSMPFPATVSAGASLGVYVQFCAGAAMNVTFDDPLIVSTSQSINPQTFMIQAVSIAAAGVADASASPQGSVKLSPNPASDQISILMTLANSAMLDISLYDAAGHFVTRIFSGRKEAGTFSLPFDARSIPSGAYFVHANIDGTIVQTKLDMVK